MARSARTKGKRKTSARRRKSKYSKRKSAKRTTRRTKRKSKSKRRKSSYRSRRNRYKRKLDYESFALWNDEQDKMDVKPNFRPPYTGGTATQNDIMNESKVDGQGFYGIRGHFGRTRLRFGL